MYYVKIPLRHLCQPWELNVPEDQRDAVWAARVTSLLEDLHKGVIPAWSVSTDDLKSIVLLQDGAESQELNEDYSQYEDDLPADMPETDYDKWYSMSKVDGVRIGPKYPFRETER